MGIPVFLQRLLHFPMDQPARSEDPVIIKGKRFAGVVGDPLPRRSEGGRGATPQMAFDFLDPPKDIVRCCQKFSEFRLIIDALAKCHSRGDSERESSL